MNSTSPGILAWYLYGTIVSQGKSNTWYRYLCEIGITDYFRYDSKETISPIATEASRCYVVFCSFCVRQHLQFHFDFLPVRDLSETRDPFFSWHSHCHFVQGNCHIWIHSRDWSFGIYLAVLHLTLGICIFEFVFNAFNYSYQITWILKWSMIGSKNVLQTAGNLVHRN